MRKHNYIIGIILLSCISIAPWAQEKNELMLNVSYFNSNNQIQYLKATTKAKINEKLQMIPGMHLNFYITEKSPGNLLGKGITNEKGEATVLISSKAKDEWLKSAKQNFIVVAEATKNYDETEANVEIKKARLKIDTTEDRQITATLLELNDSVWTPVKDVDVRVAIKRLGGDLNVNETPSYTTDSLGVVTAEFKRDGLPGDVKGNLVLIARVDDNDAYGNLTVEKIVPWGSAFHYTSEFDKRTLFARRGKSPLWLELMAFSIIGAVWFVLLYLVFQIRKIKKLGKSSPDA